MMTLKADYLAKAAAAEAEAAKAGAGSNRQILLEIAERWRILARQVEDMAAHEDRKSRQG